MTYNRLFLFELRSLLLVAALMWVGTAYAQSCPTGRGVYDAMPEGHWAEVSCNTMQDVNPCPDNNCGWSGDIGIDAVIQTWSGGAFADKHGELGTYIIGPNGGHRAYDGSEFYKFDLATRRWTVSYAPYPSPAVNYPTCLYPNGQPVPSHTYGNQGYAPNIGADGAYVLFACTDDTQSGPAQLARTWTYDLAADTGWVGHDDINDSPTGSWVSYDETRDSFWFFGNSPSGNQLVKMNLNAAPGSQKTGYGPQGWHLDLSATIDPVHDIAIIADFNYSCSTCNQIDIVDLKTQVRYDDVATTGGAAGLSSTQQMGMEYVPALGGTVFYKGRGETNAYLLKPPAGASTINELANGTWTWETLSATGGVTPQAMVSCCTGRIYSRWQWAEELGVFILVQRTNGPVYAYKPVTNGAAAPAVSLQSSASSVDSGSSVTLTWTVSNATLCTAGGDWSGQRSATGGSEVISDITTTSVYSLICTGTGSDSDSVTVNVSTQNDDADADWLTRANAPGVTMATRFDTEAEVMDHRQGPFSGNVSWDNTIKTSGAGSLRFNILKTDGTNHGDWRRYLKPDQSEFGAPGDEFYIQYRLYTPEYLIRHYFKGDRFGPGDIYGGGFKSSTTTQYVATNSGYSIVVQNTLNRGYPQAYHYTPPGALEHFQSVINTACGPDFLITNLVDRGPNPLTGNDPATGQPWTACQQDRARYGGLYTYGTHNGEGTDPDPLTGAEPYEKDGWITILQRVKIGPNGMTQANNIIEFWVARDGQPYYKVMGKTAAAFGGSGQPGSRFDALWLNAYMTAAEPDPTREDTFMIFDEVIVSTDFIPAPNTGGLPPLDPPPTVDLGASSTSILEGGSVVLSWSSTDADSCTASGDWSGSRPVSGQETVGPLGSNSQFVLTCSNADGSTSDSVSITVSAPQPTNYDILQSSDETHSDPVALEGAIVADHIYAFVSPDNGITQVQFFLDDPDMLGTVFHVENVAPYDFQGPSGYDTTLLGNGNHSITALILLAGGGNEVVTVNFDVQNEVVSPAPELTFFAANVSIDYNGFATLQWSSSDATSCQASGGWAGSRPLNGSDSVGPLTNDSTFFLTCTGPGGSVTLPVTILVGPPPVASVTLTASPSSVAYQGSTLLSWSSSDATSCTASGDWSGTRPIVGNETIGPLVAAVTYTLTCTGPGGPDSATATVSVGPAPAPTLTLSATPNPTDYNGAATLSWTSSNTSSCLATGAWSGARATSGSLTVGPLTADATYGLTCSGPAGDISRSVTLAINPPPPPQLILSANPTSVDYQGSSSLIWSTVDATTCIAGGGWSGPRGLNGSESTGALTADQTYTLTCQGAGGATVSQSATVTVGSAPLPSISFSALPTTVDYDGATQLTWSVQNANSCTASGGWSGALAVNGSEAVGPLQQDTNFVLTCTGVGGSDSATVSVSVTPPPPSVTLTAMPESVEFQGSTTLSWDSSNADSCTASGGWTGGRALAGSEAIGPLTADSTYQLICSGPGGQTPASATVTVAAPGAPSLSLQATPLQVANGGTSVLNWTASNVDGCTASGAWSGPRALSGTETTPPLSAASTFTLSCTGPGGDIERSTVVTIQPPAPTLQLTATPQTIDYQGSVTLDWSSNNATSCTALGGWSGTRPASGTETIVNLTHDQVFSLLCSGAGGDVSQSVGVTVNAAPGPEVTLTASPAQLGVGETSTLSWTSANVTSCQAAGAWSGARAPSGSEQVGPIDADSSYSLVCSGPSGQASDTVFIELATNSPTANISAAPAAIDFGGDTVVTWSTTGADSCTAFGGWSGSKATTGSEAIAGLQSDSEFILGCSGIGGSVTVSTTVSVGAPTPPTVTFMTDANSVDYDGTAVLSWTSENADACQAFGSWTGSRATSGSETVGPLTADSTFVLLCTGSGGSTARSQAISVSPAAAPQITLTATPFEVPYGDSAELQWTTSNADFCIASGDWSDPVGLQGQMTVGPLLVTSTYNLVCSGPGGSAGESVNVIVANPAQMTLQDFESLPVDTAVPGWYLSDADYSRSFAPLTFTVAQQLGNHVLSLARTGNDYHAHYLQDQSTLWRDYRYTGRMYLAGASDRLGVTALSEFPSGTDYYRLGYEADGAAFVLTSRGTVCSGDLDTGVVPAAGSWYRFSLEAASSGAATEVRAKVWQDGDPEPAGWQAECMDTSANRRLTGAPGLWASRADDDNVAYWDDLAVAALDENTVFPPTLNLTASPSIINAGGFSTIAWSSKNVDSCTASGDWNGVRLASGSELVGPLVEDSTFTLVCDGPGGNTSRSVAVAVTSNTAPPEVVISADPSSVPTGGSTVLTWNATNAAICAASGGWAGVRQTSGSVTISGIVRDTVFGLACIGPGGTTSALVEVLLSDIPRDPELQFQADFRHFSIDDMILLNWESQHTDDCVASGSWTGTRLTSGSELVGPVDVAETYTLSCSGRGGIISAEITVSFVDSDQDGMPDVWEEQFFGDLSNTGDGDSDGDGLVDREEYIFGTNPWSVDSDNDGTSDYDEIQFGSDPNDDSDTYTSNAPQRPLLPAMSQVPLWGFATDVTSGYVDPNAVALSHSEWQFALDANFAVLVFERSVNGRTDCSVPAGIFDPGVSYHVRTRHVNVSGIPSQWSEVIQASTMTSYPNDADGNGIDDAYQAAADADANANGVADADEGICNLHDAEGNSLVGFATNSGVTRCYRSVPNRDLPAALTVDGELPYGMFSFRVEGLFVNPADPAQVFVTLWLPEAIDTDAGWIIWDQAGQQLMDFTDHVTVNDNRVIISYVDGGFGDKDGVVNGVIVDPGGPLLPERAAPTPAPQPPQNPDNKPDSGGGGTPAPLALLLMSLWLLRRHRTR